jgi:hypothetical protein
MTDVETMVRTEIAVNGGVHFLAQGQDLDDLKRRIVAAMKADGDFVNFTVVGNREVSVLVSPGTQVTFSIETVPFDARDTGDEDTPFGGFYDLI